MAIRELPRCDVPSSGLQPDWMSWFYLRWFIMLLDMMHGKQDPLLSVSQYHGLTLDTTLFTLFSFPILIYVSFHRGKWREAGRDVGLIGSVEEGHTWGKLRAVNKWRKLKGNVEGLIECFELNKKKRLRERMRLCAGHVLDSAQTRDQHITLIQISIMLSQIW